MVSCQSKLSCRENRRPTACTLDLATSKPPYIQYVVILYPIKQFTKYFPDILDMDVLDMDVQDFRPEP